MTRPFILKLAGLCLLAITGCASMERSNLLDRCERECRNEEYTPIAMETSLDGMRFKFDCGCKGRKK